MQPISHFRRSLLAGLLILLPLALTLWLFSVMLGPVQRFVTPPVVALLRWSGLAPLLDLPGAGVATTLVGILLTLIIIYLVGVVGSNVIGRRVVTAMDNLALSIPLVKSIYGSARQFLETFSAGRRGTFESVVLVEYPRRGLFTVGLVTSRTAGEPQAITTEDLVNVFVPTTPNPTSGVLVMVPSSELAHLEMTVEEALRLVVSGGIVVPGPRGGPAASDRPGEGGPAASDRPGEGGPAHAAGGP